MTTEREKLWKKLRSELIAVGVSTKSVSSEDGSSMSMRSADEIKRLLDLAADEDDAASRKKVRFLSTKPPGAY